MEFGEEKFLDFMEQDAEAIRIIADAGNVYIERLKLLLKERPEFYAQKELLEKELMHFIL